MDDRALTESPLRGAVAGAKPQAELHPIMGYIGAVWPNFGAGKTADQKRMMIAVWEQALADIPLGLQRRAIDAKVRAGQKWQPSSPAELREWCDAVQPPMDAVAAAFYQSSLETGVIDAAFCRRQLEKYEAARAEGRNAYAGWD